MRTLVVVQGLKYAALNKNWTILWKNKLVLLWWHEKYVNRSQVAYIICCSLVVSNLRKKKTDFHCWIFNDLPRTSVSALLLLLLLLLLLNGLYGISTFIGYLMTNLFYEIILSISNNSF